jgi:hypothetical protein
MCHGRPDKFTLPTYVEEPLIRGGAAPSPRSVIGLAGSWSDHLVATRPSLDGDPAPLIARCTKSSFCTTVGDRTNG